MIVLSLSTGTVRTMYLLSVLESRDSRDKHNNVPVLIRGTVGTISTLSVSRDRDIYPYIYIYYFPVPHTGVKEKKGGEHSLLLATHFSLFHDNAFFRNKK